MTDQECCPRCGSNRVVGGHIAGGNIIIHFAPDGLGFLAQLAGAFTSALPLGGRGAATAGRAGFAVACCDCGLVWSELDASELRSRLRESGTDEIKARLELDNDTPTPDDRPVSPRRGGRDRDGAS